MEDAVFAAAARFRAALDEGGLSHATFGKFPRGSCGNASELLGQYMRECGLGDWTYHSALLQTPGEEFPPTHAWLEQDGLIVDITADQFDNGLPAVLVTRDFSWHASLQPMAGDHRAGLDYYGSGPIAEPLRADYRVLRQRADASVDS